jgi:uncharacterized tellurite resistance protein B-like protein
MVHNRSHSRDFGASQWKYLFRLLGLIVVADKKVVPEEVEAYVSSMRELALLIDPKIVMTQRMVRDWLTLNKLELTEMVESLEYDTVLLSLLKEIKFLPYKLDIITAMVNIAIADNNYSDMKQMFVKKTILYWNVKEQEKFLKKRSIESVTQIS